LKVTVPVGLPPPEIVAVSETLPPSVTEPDAAVAIVGEPRFTVIEVKPLDEPVAALEFPVALTTPIAIVCVPVWTVSASMLGSFVTLKVKSILASELSVPGKPSVSGLLGVRVTSPVEAFVTAIEKVIPAAAVPASPAAVALY
jgi:hypothetical protein